MSIHARQGEGRKLLLAYPAAFTRHHHELGLLDAAPAVAVAGEL